MSPNEAAQAENRVSVQQVPSSFANVNNILDIPAEHPKGQGH